MVKYIFSLIIIITAISELHCQSKMLTIKDAVWERSRDLKVDDIENITWRSDKKFTFIDDGELIEFDIEKGKKSEFVSLDALNKILVKAKLDELASFPKINWVNSNQFYMFKLSKYITIDIEKKKVVSVIKIPKEAENINYKSINGAVAYTLGNNFYVKSADDIEQQVTNEENLNIVNGQVVHRYEFGIQDGSFWSPSGKYIAFYRMDESKVTDYPLVNVKKRVAKLNNIKYPMAGMASHEVSIGVYEPEKKSIIYLKTGEPKDQYLTNIVFSPDGKYIFVAVLNREQNHMKLNKYEIETGELVKTIFEEKHEKYVEPLNPMIFLKNNPGQFIWQSRRDGFNHLYLYNINGELIRQLTKGDWEVTKYIGSDENDKEMFFIATKESPLERHIYKVDLLSSLITKLSREPGFHSVIPSGNINYLIDKYSSVEVPNKIDLLNSKGEVLNNLLTAKNPLSGYNMPEIEISSLESKDGVSLFYRMIKPLNFDSTKQYPVLLYVYGGPHIQLIRNKWLGGAGLWDYYMAQQGYLVYTLDNRGSANRGLEFENAIFRKLGQVEMKDQISGINFLKSHTFVDTNKIGVFGWSYGGFMTISLMLNYPEIFKVGVSGGPVIDWKYYEVMYTERYMDTPENNTEGFVLTNLNNYVENLNGRLLVIHGAIDNTVVWQHSLSFLNKCIEEGKLVDYFVYPNHPHNVGGYDRIHLMEKITQYFNDFLK